MALSCQPGYIAQPAPLGSQCSLCPLGTLSSGSSSQCLKPNGFDAKEFSASCEYTSVANRAVCKADRLANDAVVVMFPTGSFVNPVRMAIDGQGQVYTADSRNSMVLVHSQTGLKSTMVGNQFESFSNVRVDSNGDVIITDMQTYRVRKVTAANGIVLTMAGGQAFYD